MGSREDHHQKLSEYLQLNAKLEPRRGSSFFPYLNNSTSIASGPFLSRRGVTLVYKAPIGIREDEMQMTASRLVLVLVSVICLMTSALGFSQGVVPGAEGLVPFLDPSHMTTPTTNQLWFEGSLAVHFTVYRNFFDSVRDSRPNNNWAVLFTPGIVVRMIRARSYPVRMPSYMPRLDVQQLFHVRYHDGAETGGKPSGDFWEWHGTLGHHSNGQDGCVYLEQNPALQCMPSFANAKAVGTPNLHDGNFSTNYWRVGIDHRHTRIHEVSGKISRQEMMNSRRALRGT
jgi:hypothetical protein